MHGIWERDGHTEHIPVFWLRKRTNLPTTHNLNILTIKLGTRTKKIIWIKDTITTLLKFPLTNSRTRSRSHATLPLWLTVRTKLNRSRDPQIREDDLVRVQRKLEMSHELLRNSSVIKKNMLADRSGFAFGRDLFSLDFLRRFRMKLDLRS